MFSKPSMATYIEIEGDYSIGGIFLSVAIAAFATYTALVLFRRLQQNSFFHRRIWLALVSVALGFGVWSMHFVGMNALWMPFEMQYDYHLTILSIVPAIITSYIAFALVSRPEQTWRTRAFSGLVLGIGVSTMHYIGMLSMEMEAFYRYDLSLFLLSILSGIVMSYIAISVFTSTKFSAKHEVKQGLASALMGIAISSMHYIGMVGTTFYVHMDQLDHLPPHNYEHMFLLNTMVSIGIITFLLILFFATYIDRYVDYWTVNYDPLTKLPNRRSWELVLEKGRPSGDVAIWYFPEIHKINERFGFKTGDEVLRHIGSFFAMWKFPSTELYKISGNRFLLHGRSTECSAKFHKRLVMMAEVLSRGLAVKNQLMEVRTVCALAESNGKKPVKELYQDAQSILAHQSISTSECAVILYDADLHGLSFEQGLLSDIKRAMQDDQLFLVYQPKISSSTGSLYGVEALLRWNHTSHGFLSPGVFIPILEKHGRMEEVTDWIIDKVCQQLNKWDTDGVVIPQVAINIPGDYMTKPQLLEGVIQLLQDYGIEPSRIELEMTETSIAESIEEVIEAVQVFQELGLSVALDDFGTGVSSLSYLRQLPISAMKIDKSFIDNIPSDAKDSSVLTAILGIGQSLNLQMVIEGIESKEQVAFLGKVGYELIYQGYYFGKPMGARELRQWLDNDRQRRNSDTIILS